MPTKLDQRRLRDGEKAASLEEPTTVEEIKQQLEVICDGARALQSLDDLGSPEANQDAWDQMLALEARANVLRDRLTKLELASA